MRHSLARCVLWGLDTLSHATAHPVFWLLVLGYSVGVTVALILVTFGQPDTNVQDVVIRLQEHP